MLSPPIGHRELDLLVGEIRHVQSEHARASSESVRRRLHARLLDLEERFERALKESVPDEDIRHAWRSHLQRGTPAPDKPLPVPMLLFQGRSEAGSEVVVRAPQNGELPVEVDGALVHRVVALDLRHDRGAWVFHLANVGDFRETFTAPGEAIEALRAWVDRPRGEPPWEHVRELAADGLVDRHFALTPRGRRALDRAAP
jgi:hypothetical protein